MSTKYQVVDSRGKTHTRTTEERTYTHAVVAHYPEHKGHDGRTWPTADRVSWAGSLRLAQKSAGTWKRAASVEIIEAQVVDKRATVKA